MTLPGIAPTNRVISHQIALQVMRLAQKPSLTFSLIADELGVSIPSAIRIFTEHCPVYKPELGRVICIDEVYLGRKSRKKYAVVVLDFETGTVIDFIYGRSVDDCTRALYKYSREERYKVEYVSTDMYSGFYRVAKSVFPKAKICVDSFHVISLITNELDAMIRNLRKHFDRNSNEYYLLKKYKYLLLKNENNIDWYKSFYSKKLGYYTSNIKLKSDLFSINPELELFYNLKENYIHFNRTLQPTNKQFDNLINEFKRSSIEPLKRVSRTLIKNYDYIMNSFTRIHNRRISNGPIEATNSIIKQILRNASGYRNEDLLRSRVMYVLNNRTHKKGGNLR